MRAESKEAASAPDFIPCFPRDGEERREPSSRTESYSSAADTSAEVLAIADTNPYSALDALRAVDSPLREVPVPKGILALASLIVAECDAPGIGNDDLELILRMTLYLAKSAVAY